LSSKLIINAAITGCVFTQADTPHLPVTIREITDCALRARDAGASVVHLHARHADQTPSFDGKAYRKLVDSVRAACGDLIVCVSLSGRHVQEVARRAAALESRPDLATLTLGSMNFAKEPSLNAPDAIRELAARIYDAGAVPELEIFEAGFLNYAAYLIKKGVLRPPYYVNFILGSLGTAPLDLVGLGHMVSLLPPGATWGVGGLGRYQIDANVMALAAGGHVRVGLEDNLYLDRERTKLADNIQLIERIARIGKDMGREPATPAEARQIIGLGASKHPSNP